MGNYLWGPSSAKACLAAGACHWRDQNSYRSFCRWGAGAQRVGLDVTPLCRTEVCVCESLSSRVGPSYAPETGSDGTRREKEREAGNRREEKKKIQATPAVMRRMFLIVEKERKKAIQSAGVWV